MNSLQRWFFTTVTCLGAALIGGCSTASLVLGAAGVATDTSMTWDIVKHVHAQLTEGDARPCALLDSVERAVNPRCGEFVAGSLQVRDVVSVRRGECILTTAARDARLWSVLPELIAKGARPEDCAQSPLIALVQTHDCPDLVGAAPDVRRTLARLAEDDPRAVHHDVMRWLSCPNSRAVGLDATLAGWHGAGALKPGALAFSPLSALHPSYLGSTFAISLEAEGHTAQAALGGYLGERPPGFEEALRSSDWGALDWWLARVPQLVNGVPPRQGDQLTWLPLARVLVPNFLARPESRADMVGFLMARGADPRRRLPSDPACNVVDLARALKSPLADVLAAAPSAEVLASASDAQRALKLATQRASR